MKKSFLILLILMALNHTTQAQEDKYLWLEEVDGQKALQYVNEQNKATFDKLSLEKEYQSIYDKNLEIYNSNEQIAFPSILGKYVYNFWKDKEHIRGIWRRCLLTDYLNKSMIWETLLDIDALSEKDNKKWVYKGASGLYPDYNRFLISLSNGGGDAVVVKEFDVTKKEFVDLGFTLAESKGNISYVDENTVIVATNFGEGTMTTSGYPLLIKLWKRGTPIGQAQAIYEGVKSDVSCSGYVMRDGDVSYTFLERNISFFSGEKLVWKDNIPFYLDLPEDSKMKGILKNQLILQLKSDWLVAGESYKNGSLLSVNFTELLNGTLDVKTILVPDSYSSISEVSLTKNKLLVNILSNVTSELYIYSYSDSWSSKIVKAPELGTISIVSTDEASDYYFFTFENFITPSTLYKADAYNNSFSKYQSLPVYFDATNYIVEQFNAQSKDGTLVPYFIVRPKQMKYNGSNPTLIYAYGGFEISMQPFYMSTYGASWLENGGVFVLANIRGGGEYGPQWHQAGMKEKRQNVFDDFYAVSEDLLTRKITSPKNLGIMGGSNGGLLVGVAFTQRPDLFNAAVCQVPLLDMERYNKLLAGASWMGEYGNPDVPAEWDYIKKYSPYQNLNKKMKYPEVFFYTSTRDDRVHPGHARKMNAKMQDMGYTTYYYENTEGGHAGSSTNEQRAKSNALTFSYLLMKLKSI